MPMFFFLETFLCQFVYVILEYITIPQSWRLALMLEGLSTRGEGDDRG